MNSRKTSVGKNIQVLSSRFGKLNQILLLVSDEINCQVLIYVLSAARTFIKPELGVKSYQQHDVQENRKDQPNSVQNCSFVNLLGGLIPCLGLDIIEAWSS